MSQLFQLSESLSMFTVFDAFIIVAIIISASLGLSRGLTREVSATVAAITGVSAGIFIIPKLLTMLNLEFSWKINIAIIGLSSFIIMCTIIIISSNITDLLWLKKWYRKFDRVTGLVFGVIRGYVLVGLVYLFFIYSHGNNIPPWIKDSSFVSIGTSSAHILQPYIPTPKVLS